MEILKLKNRPKDNNIPEIASQWNCKATTNSTIIAHKRHFTSILVKRIDSEMSFDCFNPIRIIKQLEFLLYLRYSDF